jgi:hypothetical protein
VDWLGALGGLRDTLGLRPRLTFALFAVCLTGYLIAPALGLPKWAHDARPWLGLAAAVLAVLWVLQLGYAIVDSWQAERRLAAQRDLALRHLSTLNPEEVLALLYCYTRNQRTIYLRLSDPVAHSLTDKGLLRQGSSGHTWWYPFEVPDFVWEHLHTHGREEIERTLAEPGVDQALMGFPQRSLL